MFLRIAVMLLFAVTGFSALGLNFATIQATPAYRRCLFLLSATNLISVALVYYESIDNLLLASALPAASLFYAIMVACRERVRTIPSTQRRIITRSRLFRLTAIGCLVCMGFLFTALRQKKWDFKPVTPIQDAVVETDLTVPSQAEQADRTKWQDLNRQTP